MQRPGKPEARGRPTPRCGRTDLDESATPAPVRQFDDQQAVAADGTGLLEAILEEVDRFSGGRPPADDMTLLTVRRV